MENKTKNPNHPRKGDNIRVEPIHRIEDVQAIKKLLSDSPRDLLLFTIGVNNGLRVGDLLRLRVKDVRNLKPGQYITVKESKTRKQNILMVNKAVHKSLTSYMEKLRPNDDDFLFASRKTQKPLTVQSVNALVKKWTKTINLYQGNYGTHTLRKTFGYIQRIKFGTGFEVLAKRFNHSSPSVTMRYLGITDKEVNGILMNEI
ncbi:MAG: tyrosine-type recombinase/integrase [Candidatus Hodarchaeota archaeon]